VVMPVTSSSPSHSTPPRRRHRETRASADVGLRRAGQCCHNGGARRGRGHLAACRHLAAEEVGSRRGQSMIWKVDGLGRPPPLHLGGGST